MKKLRIGALAGAVAFLVSGSVFGQTCASPTTLTSAGVPSTNLCTQGSALASKFCVFNNNPALDYAFSFNLAAGYSATTVTLTNVGGGWTPQMVIQKACASTSDCTSTATAVSATAGSTLAIALTDSSNASMPLAAGSYFLLVSGSGGDTTNCGTFSLGVNGSLPVSLSSFSVD